MADVSGPAKKPSAQAALASFTEWFWKTHPEEYGQWKDVVQKASHSAVPEAKQDEDAQRFQRRVREEGPALFQSAMWRVHGTMEQMQCWLSWTAVQQKLAMRATQTFLLRTYAKRGLRIVGSADTEAVDLRLSTLCRALGSSLELEHWKFEENIKAAITSSDDNFARLCDAAQPLAELDAIRDPPPDPLDVLAAFKAFTDAVIAFLKSHGKEPTMDSQVDVALHTLVQLAPERLYHHIKVVESLVWEPWISDNESQFCLLLMTSVVVALYSINTTHFNMEPRLFQGLMASHGFHANEFLPRAPGTKLPPPFDNGPPLGEGLAEPHAAAAEAGPRGTRTAAGARAEGRASKHATRAHIARLELAGASLVQEQALAASLVRSYPFLLQTSEDMFVKDVQDLLEQYRAVVLKYEGLKAALAAAGAK